MKILHVINLKVDFTIGLVLLCLFISKCSNNNSNKSSDLSLESAKWYMYVLTYDNYAKYTSVSNLEETKIKYPTLECSLKLAEIKKEGDDTTIYFFNWIHERDSTYLSIYPVNYVGIGFINNKAAFPVIPGIVLSPELVDSSIKRITLMEQNFVEYLKTYQGKYSDWLYQELIRRKLRNS